MPHSDIQVWITEDNDLLRSTLHRLCNETPGLACDAAFSRSESLLQTLRETPASRHPHVLLLDVGLPGKSGLQILPDILAHAPQCRVLILTVFEDETKITQAISSGASGYLLKGSTPDEILAAIKQAHEGGTPMSPAVASRVFALLARLTKPAVPVELSTREKELLQLLVEGLTNKEISTRLQISPHTTDTHLRHLFTKLGVKNRAAAVARALKDGLA
jgi:two-component system nitrate/nitrite response regulator NarL